MTQKETNKQVSQVKIKSILIPTMMKFKLMRTKIFHAHVLCLNQIDKADHSQLKKKKNRLLHQDIQIACKALDKLNRKVTRCASRHKLLILWKLLIFSVRIQSNVY